MPKVSDPISFNCPLSVPSLCSGLLLMVQIGSKMGSIAAKTTFGSLLSSSPRPCMRKRTLSAYRLGNLAGYALKRYVITLLWSQKAHTETNMRDSKVRFNVAYSQDQTRVHVGSALWPAFDFLE